MPDALPTSTPDEPVVENDSTPDVPAQESSEQDRSALETSDAKPEGDAPQGYEPFTLPDGVTVADEDLAVFTDLGQRYGLPQEGAQELVDLAIKVQEATLSQFSEALESSKQAEIDGWRDALKSDEKLGGTNYEATARNVNAFANSGLISDSLHQFLTERGLYSHPEVAGLFATLGAMLQEDAPAVPSTPTDGKSPAQRMFANSTAN